MSTGRRLGPSPFLLLCVMGGLAAFSASMARNPVLPLFVSSLGVDEGTLGIIAAVSSITGVAVALPAGILADMVGRRRVILASMIIFASAPFFYLVVTNPEQLVLVRIYQGLGSAILAPAAFAVVADTFRAGRGERMGWYSSASQVGRLVAPSVGGLLLVGNDFARVFIACGLLGVSALAAFGVWNASQPAEPAMAGSKRPASTRLRQMGAELRLVVSSRVILLTSVMEALQFMAYGSIEIFLPLYLTGIGYAPYEVGFLFTVQVLAMALSRPIMGRLSDRLGRRSFIAVGLILGAATVTAMPLANAYWQLVVLASSFGIGMASVTGCTAALVSDLTKAGSYGSALGVLGSIRDTGHAAGPVLVGFLVLSWTYQASFGLVGAIMATGGIIFGLLVPAAMCAGVPIGPDPASEPGS